MVVESLKGHPAGVPLAGDIAIWRPTARIVAQKRFHRRIIEKKIAELVTCKPRMDGARRLINGEGVASEPRIEYIDLG
ncbi:MAG TPA: hypothetical protein VMU41_10640 [Candidatus Binataceae bacterium]|nr:hypothetical protein [Candidatus Binataceae bacterium]